MRRINVVGTSGSGKSTFAKRLAKIQGAPYVELDLLFWKADWQESSDEEFFAKIESALQGASWVLDGNYNRTKAIKWKNVDAVIWIDPPFPVLLWQAVTRALSRSISRKELWPHTGNIEHFSRLFSKESIVWWMMTSFRRVRRRYESDMNDPAYAHIPFIRLRSRAQSRAFLKWAQKNCA